MITDNIRNASLYYGVSDGIKAAFEFLTTHDLSKLEPGKHQIDGDRMYLLIVDYDTKPLDQGKWEIHRKYIDVQYVVCGSETMGRVIVDGLSTIEAYDSEKDIEFLTGEGAFFMMNKGDFAVFFPDDAHMPGMTATSPQAVRKAVVKVLAE
ncbi:MAG: YhcH/YjgK/YiaL family protein [Armatimonadota bacterium]